MAEISRCKWCRISYNNFKNHLYSEKHKQLVLSILRKFKTKVKHAKVLQKSPEVESVYWEKDCTFWCHFCEVEHQKHLHLDEATVKYGSFLKHLSDPSHAEKMEKFWCHQRLRDQKTESYTISEDKFNEFEKKASVAVKEYITAKEEDFAEKLAEFRKIEYGRQQQVSCVTDPMMTVIPERTATTERKIPGETSRGYRTVAAKGAGLTCLSMDTSAVGFNGNVYTGATPPWETEDSETSSGIDRSIGPTQADYQRHLAEEKTRKLPANRVGAKPEESGGAGWMPSFGRVWSKHSRQQQRKWPFKGLSGKTASNHQEMPYHRKTVPQRTREQTNNINTTPSTVVNNGHCVTTAHHGSNTASCTDVKGGPQASNLGYKIATDNSRPWNVGVKTEEQTYSRTSDVRLGRGWSEGGNRAGSYSTSSTSNSANSIQRGAETGGYSQRLYSVDNVPGGARPYVKRKHSNNTGLGKIEISPNLL